MNTFGLNMFGGGGGGIVYRWIGPELDIETQKYTTDILVQAFNIEVDTQVFNIEVATEIYTITFTQEGNDVIIGT